MGQDWHKDRRYIKAKNIALERDFGENDWARCHICHLPVARREGLGFDELKVETDHIEAPRGRAELYFDYENLAISHRFCNGRKGDKTLTHTMREDITAKLVRFLKGYDLIVVNDKIVKTDEADSELLLFDKKRGATDFIPNIQYISTGLDW